MNFFSNKRTKHWFLNFFSTLRVEKKNGFYSAILGECYAVMTLYAWCFQISNIVILSDTRFTPLSYVQLNQEQSMCVYLNQLFKLF